MYHVDNSTGVPVMPQPSPVTSETELFFTEGGNGVPPTYPGPDWFNIIQSELLNILISADLKPDKMTNTQILTALKKLFLSRSNPFGDIKNDGAEAIATALSNLGLVPGIILPEGYNIPAHIVNTPGIVYSAQFPGTYTNEPAFGGEWFDVYAAKHVSDACTLIAVSRTGKIATGSYSANTFSGWNYSLNSSNTTQAGRDLIGKESKTEMVKYLGLDTIPGCLLNIKTITTSGMYTPMAGTKSIIVEAIGGGGASGNLTATGATQNAISAAGSNGAYAKARYTSGFSSVSVTVGAGGTVNGAGGGNGGDGGTTSFGSLLVCPAGKGSGVGTAKTPPFNEGAAQPSSSPSGTGIIISRNGPFSSWPTVVALGMGSNFANSIISPLAGYGLGGDGVASNASEPARNGNPGSSGVVIVWEYS
ncbi:hypothetical protein OSC00_09480 [Citrobacter freundii]|uniref:hypothetical protein n=1 Tax=Citrobacter freundii TaxID=546 RepID=UPI002876A14D|nr:hypothetical protein [Citrobacter freundii]MDS0992101.1 hypothetical protein [Citrobacter freundii]